MNLSSNFSTNKEYRYGCSIDCGGTPLRVYERTLGSQGGWTSLEDYLQAGNALWYGENQMVNHGQDKVALMTSEADPIDFERADSNGMPIQAELEPCLCIAFSAGVCGPSLEGCASPCEEMPSVLPPNLPGNSNSFNPNGRDFHGLGAVAIGVIIGGTIGGSWYLIGCSGAAYGSGSGTLEACKRIAPGNPNCDKLAHCIGACVGRKCGTIVFSWCFGILKEFSDWANPFDRDTWDPADLAANHEGERCAKAGPGLRTCATCCLNKYPIR